MGQDLLDLVIRRSNGWAGSICKSAHSKCGYYLEMAGKADGGGNALGTYSEGWRPPLVVDPKPIQCRECNSIFETKMELEAHHFEDHAVLAPSLLLRRRTCSREQTVITSPTIPADWSVENCTSTTFNGRNIRVGDVGKTLSSIDSGFVKLVLSGEDSEQAFRLSFRIADTAELSIVDSVLRSTFDGGELRRSAIDTFLSQSAPHRSARDYRDGIASYLYGILAKNYTAESGLERDAYRSKFEEASKQLDTFDTPVAHAICSQISFHFNHFEQAEARAYDPKVNLASQRFLNVLGLSASEKPLRKLRGDWVGYSPQDPDLELVINWTLNSDKCTSVDLINEMEQAVPYLERVDRFKVLILLAGHLAEIGDHKQGIFHANKLRDVPLASRWLENYLQTYRK